MPFDHDSLPMRLFTASHERAWNPGGIDLSRERSDWLALTDDEVEGVAAEAGYTLYDWMFQQSGRFSGLERGIRLIQRDEARHIAFGVHVLQRLLAGHPGLIELFQNEVAGLRRLAEDDPDGVLAGFEPGNVPFGVDRAAFRQRCLDQFEEMQRRVGEHSQWLPAWPASLPTR